MDENYGLTVTGKNVPYIQRAPKFGTYSFPNLSVFGENGPVILCLYGGPTLSGALTVHVRTLFERMHTMQYLSKFKYVFCL